MVKVQVYKSNDVISHRSVKLHKYINVRSNDQIIIKKPPTNIYLLVEQLTTSSDNNYIKYLSINVANCSLLPTSKPFEYYTDQTNIIQNLTLKLNSQTNICLIIFKKLDILDIFKYKISYYELPQSYNTIKLSEIFKSKSFYYTNSSNQKKLIKYDDSESDLGLSDIFVSLSI